jgi:hypothetical protein
MAKQLNIVRLVVGSKGMFRRAAVCVFSLLALSSEGVAAQQACAPMNVVLERFRAEHGEIPAVVMKDQRGNRLVILASPATRTWSLFVMPPTGDAVACLVAAGGEFGPAELPEGKNS